MEVDFLPMIQPMVTVLAASTHRMPLQQQIHSIFPTTFIKEDNQHQQPLIHSQIAYVILQMKCVVSGITEVLPMMAASTKISAMSQLTTRELRSNTPARMQSNQQ